MVIQKQTVKRPIKGKLVQFDYEMPLDDLPGHVAAPTSPASVHQAWLDAVWVDWFIGLQGCWTIMMP